MTNNINYQEVLNQAQLEAVTALDGPILVIAGAGSGKTRTLVYRVARLVESGVPPESILLLTFTRKAAQEMLDRAAGLADQRCRFVSGGTFHSLAFKVLKVHAEAIGYDTSFTILDRSDMEEILRSLIPELQMTKKGQRFPKRGTLANMLSKAANLQEPVEPFVREEYGQFMEVAHQIARLGKLYEEYKRANQLMDYDDLIINFETLLRKNTEVRTELGAKYAYVMVDEYQDTNSIQANIARWLAHDHRNIMVVGDDSQSIYSFRGANYRNMLDFPSIFPEARVIKLEQNYRSTQPILAMTNALMDQAGEKYTKCLYTERKGGEKPRVVDSGTEHGQALAITDYIRRQVEGGRPIEDFAVLFRAAYHSFELEAELTRQGIPYVKYGGFKFLESAHIKDFLAHMRVVVNRDETISWIRILRLIKNIGTGKSQAIIGWLKQGQVPLGELAQWPRAGKRDTGLKSLGALLGGLGSEEIRPEEAVKKVMEYYLPIMRQRFDDYPRREKELEQLIPMAGRYRKLRAFLDDLVLDPPASSADINRGERGKALTLSTIHSAKGLEWPEVFIIWAMEGRFPPSMAYNSDQDLEEERRLMYVAATRAKDRLFIYYPGRESVPVWSPYGGGGSGLSSFIAALPGDLFDHDRRGMTRYVPGTTGKRGKVANLFEDDPPPRGMAGPLSRGDKVSHPAFGPGVVYRLVPGNKVEVLFKEFGKKLLHLEYTSLTRC